MDQSIRNKLRSVVTQCRKLLEEAVRQVLQGQFGIYESGKKDEVHVEDEGQMKNLSDEDKGYRRDIQAHLGHIEALGYKAKDALAQLVREIAFTHLNRLCAYKMMEARAVWIGGKPFRESVSRGMKSQGFQFYLADHPEDKTLFDTGHQDVAYRHYLGWLGALLSEEIGVLFSPTDPANRLFPPQRVLDEVLALLNSDDLKDIWAVDETIGWVYQYFTPKELRDQVRKESAAPRNSYELAFRNQFFTPRYVVEFLTDNTLGRIWYEMRKGDTKLKDQCRYMVRRPSEIFLAEGQTPPEPMPNQDELSQEELLKQPVHIPHRPKKDPRELRILDPACGSGHFLLYCFDLLLTIYEEAYADPDLGPKLQDEYKTLDALKRDVPRLILAHNLHGIDIDLRASQIAALALWLRCQRAYREMGLKQDRPKITKSNFVCAEPMPGESEMLKEFVADLQPKVLGHLVEIVFDKMKLAGEAGSLLKIEEELRDAIADAKKKWVAETEQATDRKGQPLLFTVAEMGRMSKKTPQPQLFDFSEITDEQFWNEAESQVLAALRNYAAHAANGGKLKKQLFAEDAERGFAFIDICQKRFDVVLMNPPFGLSPPIALSYAKEHFPEASNDCFACFVERAVSILAPRGLAGTISSRLGFFLDGLEDWRRNLYGTTASLSVIADLGYGVLDAVVETAAYTIERGSSRRCIEAFSILETQDKDSRLSSAIHNHCEGNPQAGVFCVPLSIFPDLPGGVLAYWLPPQFAAKVVSLDGMDEYGVSVYSGLQTDDHFRFLRLWWEVREPKSEKWRGFAKGGEYLPFADDFHLVINWESDGRELKAFVASKYQHWSRHIKNTDKYGVAGLTYTERTTSDLSIRAMPQGMIFSVSGPAILSDDPATLYTAWAVLTSRAGKALIEMGVGSGDTSLSGTAARHYRIRVVASCPFPHFSEEEQTELAKGVEALFYANLNALVREETHRLFCTPSFESLMTIGDIARHRWKADLVHFLTASDHSVAIDRIVSHAYGLIDEEQVALLGGPHPANLPLKNCTDQDVNTLRHLLSLDEPQLCEHAMGQNVFARSATKKTYYFSRRLELACLIIGFHPRSFVDCASHIDEGWLQELPVIAKQIVSYCLGAIYGRWNTCPPGPVSSSFHPKPFDELPASSPGMLADANGHALREIPANYFLRIDSDGIIPDDPDHTDDIVRWVREVLELIWKDRADAIEKEACEILGVKELRDYFRKPGKGGFWDDHVSRYSKSRRKAPIYWLLQSSKKNYGLWLYYHRLDKDMLFKARQNYVDPKIRLEQTRLDSLRSQKTALGADAKGAKKVDKDIEKQEALLGELKDFSEKLERAAKLNFGNQEKLDSNVVYDPDLNDGVVLTIAPLWELVPWKEAKNYWVELLEGKYEWSSMGKLLRKKGLVK